MAETLEKRVSDIEQMLAHLPDDLDVRFAGADARIGERFDRLTIRLQNLETRVGKLEMAVANIAASVNGKLDEILQRLPKAP